VLGCGNGRGSLRSLQAAPREMQHGLIDEYRLMVHPVRQTRGLDDVPYRLVLLSYRLAGRD
jgi:hypothetical protein